MNDRNSIEESRRKDDSGKNGERYTLLRNITIGSIIVFFLGASTNGVYNFFNDPRMQLFPFFFSVCAGVWFLTFHAVLHFKNVPWLFMAASVFCCLFFVLTVKAIDRKIEETKNAAIKPSPHFSFVVRIGENDEELRLTNSFLHITKFEQFVPIPTGCLIVPVDSFASNVDISFTVRNDSPSTSAEGVEILLSAQKNCDMSPGLGWQPARSGQLFTSPRGETWETNKLKSFIFHVPNDILPGDGCGAPVLRLVPSSTTNGSFINLMARGKNSPATVIWFRLFTIPSVLFPRPFIGNSTNVGGDLMVTVP